MSAPTTLLSHQAGQKGKVPFMALEKPVSRSGYHLTHPSGTGWKDMVPFCKRNTLVSRSATTVLFHQAGSKVKVPCSTKSMFVSRSDLPCLLSHQAGKNRLRCHLHERARVKEYCTMILPCSAIGQGKTLRCRFPPPLTSTPTSFIAHQHCDRNNWLLHRLLLNTTHTTPALLYRCVYMKYFATPHGGIAVPTLHVCIRNQNIHPKGVQTGISQ